MPKRSMIDEIIVPSKRAKTSPQPTTSKLFFIITLNMFIYQYFAISTLITYLLTISIFTLGQDASPVLKPNHGYNAQRCGVVRMANSAIMAKSKENKTPLVNRVKKAMEEAQAKRHSVMTFILPDLGDNTTYVSPREAMRKNRVAQMKAQEAKAKEEEQLVDSKSKSRKGKRAKKA